MREDLETVDTKVEDCWECAKIRLKRFKNEMLKLDATNENFLSLTDTFSESIRKLKAEDQHQNGLQENLLIHIREVKECIYGRLELVKNDVGNV